MQGDKQPSFDDNQEVTMGTAGLTLIPAEPLVPIDLACLLETKLLIQANSGGGKTWANRRLLEQTYGLVQHIVIDPEGEMHTLREQYDYVLAAPKGGDCVASIATAAKLAERILELGVSIIIDIYDLGPKRAAFVKVFLEALMNLPREMWAPVLVVIEEAHKFCPERGEGEAESTEAVKDLMTRGRKRGFCGVLATQRLSSLHKSAAAECNNRLIGRTALDNDQERACKALGFRGAGDRDRLAKLDNGHFYAFGPALCKTVTEIKVGAIKTTHERAGQKRRGPTPPRERVRQILSQLADLPAEAEAEAKTVDMLRAQLERARAELGKQSRIDPEEVTALKRQVDELRSAAVDDGAALDKAHDRYTALAQAAKRAAAELQTGLGLTMPIATRPAAVSSPAQRAVPPKLKTTPVSDEVVHRYIAENENARDARTVVHKMLCALAMWPKGLTKASILTLVGLAASGRTSAAFSEIEANGWWTKAGGLFVISEMGRGKLAALGGGTLPTGQTLRKQIAKGLEPVTRRAFEVICAAYPASITKSAVIEKIGLQPSGRTSRAFAQLNRRDLVTGSRGEVQATAELFWTAVHS